MKTILAFIALQLLCIAAVHAGEEWYATQTPAWYALRDVGMQNNLIGYAVGDTATLLRTTTGGRTWESVGVPPAPSLTNIDLNAVAVIPNGEMLAVGTEGRVVRVLDGSTAEVFVANSEWELSDVAFVNERDIVIVGKDADGVSLLAYSTDTGATFTRVSSPTEAFTPHAVSFYSNGLGFVVGSRQSDGSVGQGIVLRTTDGGRTWSGVLSAPDVAFTTIGLVGGDILVGGITDVDEGALYRSTNAGMDWTKEAHAELAMLSSIVGLSNRNVMATGYRYQIKGDEMTLVLCQFRSSDAGVNWGIGDIADGYQGLGRMSAATDRAIIVGDSGRAWVRWFDLQQAPSDIHFAVKHVEFGNVIRNAARDTTVMEILQNRSFESRRIKEIVLADEKSEFFLMDNYDEVEVGPQSSMNMDLRFIPQGAGQHWAVLYIKFDNGEDHAIHLSGSMTVESQNSPITVMQSYIDLGEVNNPLGQSMNAGEVFRNDGTEAVTITGLTFENGDIHAFAAENVELPMTIEPGGTFIPELRFEPSARGLYRFELSVNVADTQIRIPVVARSRVEGYNDIVNFGDVKVNTTVTMPVVFDAQDWGNVFDAVVFDPAIDPFSIVDVDGENNGWVTARVRATPLIDGVAITPLFGNWGFGGEQRAWTQRYVVVMNVTDRTSDVDDDVLASSMMIAPQPANDHVLLRNPMLVGDVTVEVVDMQGAPVLKHLLGDTGRGLDATLNLGSFNAGVYVLRLQTATQSLATPIVVR